MYFAKSLVQSYQYRYSTYWINLHRFLPTDYYFYLIINTQTLKMCVLKVVTFILLTGNFCSTFNIVENFLKDTNTLLEKSLKGEGDLKLHPDFGLDIYHLLNKHQYPLETHWVHTEDGYVLRMHRIPSGKNVTHSKATNKPAVLLMHGLTGSSMHWVIAGPNKSLAFQLADQGFDVWLGNNRGNTWSRQHVTLNPDIDFDEFWDYSYEKCGQFDLPAKIDYIIKHTGQQKIFYVGHSQGTTQFFAMGALRPEYNDKILLFSALAPVVYLNHLTSPIFQFMQKNMEKVENLLKDAHELLKYNSESSRIGGLICADGSPIEKFCAGIIFLTSGFDTPQLDKSLLSAFMAEEPSGMSKNMLIHYGQNSKSGYFQRYDYGTDLNMKYYDSAVPPNFTISNIRAPVALYFAQNDYIASVEDTERLRNDLPNVVKYKMIDNELFNHVDFILAKDLDKLVNKELIEYMKEFIVDGDTSTIAPPSPCGAKIIVANSVFSTIVLLFSVLYLQ